MHVALHGLIKQKLPDGSNSDASIEASQAEPGWSNLSLAEQSLHASEPLPPLPALLSSLPSLGL